MSYQVLARKWRPSRFDQMVGQEHILRMLMNALDQNRLHHAYLFTGTRGVGKTTLARLMAKALNCEVGISSKPCEQCDTCIAINQGRFLDLFEIDAASRTKVEDTRDLLDNVQYAPTQGRYKIYLIDEVHMLSGHSFNALLKTLEEPPEHVKFILATTDPKKLPITVLSRCLQFHLKQVPLEKISNHLAYLCSEEKIEAEAEALYLLAHAADGSLRDALSLLDQAVVFCKHPIQAQEVSQMLGLVESNLLYRLIESLIDKDGKQLWLEIEALNELGPDYSELISTLINVLHEIAIAQVIPTAKDFSEKIIQFAKISRAEDIQLYYQIALTGRRDLALCSSQKQGFEITLLRMLAFTQDAQETSDAQPKVEVVPKEKVTELPAEVNHTWENILPRLNLKGLAYVLASNCAMTHLDEQQITLALTQSHATMLNQNLSNRIEEAINHYLNKKLKLTIHVSNENLETVAQKEEESKKIKHANALDAIKTDKHVQKIMDVFGATLDLQSVTALDNEN